MLVEGSGPPRGAGEGQESRTGCFLCGEKVANEGISLYELGNFCINKCLTKSWLHPSTEVEHCLRPLCHGLPQMPEAFCSAAEHGWCGRHQHGQGLTRHQPGMTTHGAGRTRGTPRSWTLPSSIHNGCQHAVGIFAGKQGPAPGTAPSHPAGVFSKWKRVSGSSSGAARVT